MIDWGNQYRVWNFRILFIYVEILRVLSMRLLDIVLMLIPGLLILSWFYMDLFWIAK